MSAAESMPEATEATETQTQPAATPPAAAPAAKGGANLPEWAAGLDEAESAWLVSKGLHAKTPADVAKLYRNLETFKGVPAERIMEKPDWAKPESVAAYRKAVGVPETPEGYEPIEVEIPGGVLDAAPLAKLANRIHLDPMQFKGLMEGTGELLTEIFTAENDRISTENAAALVALDREWGISKAEHEVAIERAKTAFGVTDEQYELLKMGPMGEAGIKRLFARMGGKVGEPKTPFGAGDYAGPKSRPDAESEMEALMRDHNFVAKMGAGDQEALARWKKLQSIAYD